LSYFIKKICAVQKVRFASSLLVELPRKIITPVTLQH
jgi:hypothetical protein